MTGDTEPRTDDEEEQRMESKSGVTGPNSRQNQNQNRRLYKIWRFYIKLSDDKYKAAMVFIIYQY